MISGVYKIRNIVNGKFYLGSSKEIENRWEGHKQWLRGGYHNNPKLQHAWNKYGESNFVFEIVEEIPLKSLLNREQHYLDLWESYKRGKGYNICPTANGGDNFTYNPNKEKIRQCLSELSMGENNGMYGKNHTDDAIRKQKEKSIGRYTLDWFIERYGKRKGERKFEERRQMLINRKINYSYDNGMKGTKRGPMSEEVKKRISERKLKMRLIRKDLQADIVTGKYTVLQLATKYEVSSPTVNQERHRLSAQQKTPSEDGVVIG